MKNKKIIGAVAGLAIIGLAFYLYRRKSQSQTPSAAAPTGSNIPQISPITGQPIKYDPIAATRGRGSVIV